MDWAITTAVRSEVNMRKAGALWFDRKWAGRVVLCLIVLVCPLLPIPCLDPALVSFPLTHFSHLFFFTSSFSLFPVTFWSVFSVTHTHTHWPQSPGRCYSLSLCVGVSVCGLCFSCVNLFFFFLFLFCCAPVKSSHCTLRRTRLFVVLVFLTLNKQQIITNFFFFKFYLQAL